MCEDGDEEGEDEDCDVQPNDTDIATVEVGGVLSFEDFVHTRVLPLSGCRDGG